ncbi:MAG: hypothetical protein AAF985_05915 [Bacteroidota bacterium]
MNVLKTHPVIVVDNSPDRRQGMINCLRLFKEQIKTNIYNFRSGEIESDEAEEGYWEPISTIPHFQLALIHVGDAKYKTMINAKKIIWYGGHGKDDMRLQDDAPIISRKVSNKGDCLSYKEVQQLIAHMEDRIKCPDFCHADTSKDQLLDKRHRFVENLQVPSKVDWDQIYLPKKIFAGHEQEWSNFKTAVQQLIQQEKEPLSPFNEQYLKLLECFIKKTIEEDN